jgi:hypothetical protein
MALVQGRFQWRVLVLAVTNFRILLLESVSISKIMYSRKQIEVMTKSNDSEKMWEEAAVVYFTGLKRHYERELFTGREPAFGHPGHYVISIIQSDQDERPHGQAV